jgi:hypothetical protein
MCQAVYISSTRLCIKNRKTKRCSLWLSDIIFFTFSLKLEAVSEFCQRPTLIATGVIDIGDKFATSINGTSKFTTGVVDTGGKLSTSVVDTSSKFAAGVDTGGNLPMLLILVVAASVDTSGKFAHVVDTGGAP